MHTTMHKRLNVTKAEIIAHNIQKYLMLWAFLGEFSALLFSRTKLRILGQSQRSFDSFVIDSPLQIFVHYKNI